MLGIAAAQQTNSPVRLRNGKLFNETLAKAIKGDKDAQEDIGQFYLDANNWSESAKWFRQAAEHGSAYAQRSVGQILKFSDSKESSAWFLRAAKQGDDQSQMDIAETTGFNAKTPGRKGKVVFALRLSVLASLR